MPTISFSVMKDKLESRQKCQTIRRPRKRPLRVGQEVRMYWKQRSKHKSKYLGKALILSIKDVLLEELSEQEFIDDGFDSKERGIKWFVERYGFIALRMPFRLIKFEWMDNECSPKSCQHWQICGMIKCPENRQTGVP